MRGFWIIVTGLLTLWTCNAVGKPVDYYRARTVLVLSDSGGGSGVVIEDRKILSAAHVCAEDIHTVVDYKERKFKIAGRVFPESILPDLCLITTVKPLPGPGTTIGYYNSLEIGDDVVYTGFDGEWQTDVITASKVVSFLRFDNGEQLYRIKDYARPGMSGGPVFDNKGRLVGIIVRYAIRSPAHDNALFVPLHIVRKFWIKNKDK